MNSFNHSYGKNMNITGVWQLTFYIVKNSLKLEATQNMGQNK